MQSRVYLKSIGQKSNSAAYNTRFAASLQRAGFAD